ncbi:CocE/NonD family hydrolase [Phenylobacterium sp. LjRoot219]|uniref:CocE/NonD family hydrolase n=1 Tax=Phenylobacterium sp. LjRoot219 TaxID=3342283 RepID=UPI003ECFC756
MTPGFWDNLVPLKGGLYGTQTAGWTPGPPAMTRLGCQILADQMIPVDDGVSLGADVYLPKTTGRYPAVVVFGAYSKELHATGAPTGGDEVGSPPVFTDRGYAHLIVERRGMGISGGETAVFFSDRDVEDHEKVIAWAAEQPWCNGEVVLFGTSYYGCTQPMVAARRPPALKAFFCNEICTDYFRHIVAFGGTPNVHLMSAWMGANFTDEALRRRTPPLLRALASHVFNSPLKRLWWPAVQKRLPAMMHRVTRATPTRAVREMWLNWMIDGKTRETCSMPPGPHQVLHRIEVPFVAVQNLAMFNLHQFGAYELFQKAATPNDRKRLIISQAAYELPVYSWQLEALAFFDHVLRGTDNGYAAQPAVRYWLDGAERYVGAEAFPPPDVEPLRLFLARRAPDDETQVLTKQLQSGGANSWAAIPLGAPIPGGVEQEVNQFLIYDFLAESDIELAGAVTANLTFRSNEIDSYVLARLSRVDARGDDHLLSLGAISPARRRIDPIRGSAMEIAHDVGVRQPLAPGQPVVLRFSLTPGPTRLKRGEKLRLRIASRTDLVESDLAHDHAHFPLQVPPYCARNTLDYGPETYIELQQVRGPA